jgi:hypothetical protein
MQKVVVGTVAAVVLVLGAVVGVVWWERGAPPGFRPAAVPVAVGAITREHRGVATEGTVHLAVRISQVAGEQRWTLAPLMPLGDTQSREVRVLLRTERKLDDLATYEDVTVRGFARPPGRLVPGSVVLALEQAGYTVAEDLILLEEWVD